MKFLEVEDGIVSQEIKLLYNHRAAFSEPLIFHLLPAERPKISERKQSQRLGLSKVLNWYLIYLCNRVFCQQNLSLQNIFGENWAQEGKIQ